MRKEEIEQNVILRLSIEFAIDIIAYCDELELQRKYVLSRQLLKSGTAIGAMVMEAQNAESRADFIHKMKIAGKESDETQYWLILCDASKNIPDCSLLQEKQEVISRILNKIIGTSKGGH